jgi:uncharacterized protein
MRTFLPFFVMIILLYSAAAFYSLRLGLWISADRLYRRIYLSIYIFLTISYIAARLLGRPLHDGVIVLALIYIGSFWLAAMIYLFMGTILLDFFISLVKITARFSFRNYDYARLKKVGAVIVYMLVFLILVYGAINAKIRKQTDITIEAPVKNIITLALVTDVHLGRVIGRDEVELMAKRINALKPDLIIIGGDLFDEDLKPVIENNHGEYLALMKAPLGVFAVPGNHEYIGGIDQAIEYMERYGIKVLRDKAVIAGPFCLVGRDDIRSERMLLRKRKTISEIKSQCSGSRPFIVIDHEPVAISESVKEGAVLHLSGHTHNGQFWPFKYIIAQMYELGYGYEKIGNTNVYVSSGFGTWGPPVRTGNRPEIVKITIIPENK